MYQVYTQFIRPNLSIPFHINSIQHSNFVKYVSKKYADKRIFQHTELDSDGLIMTITAVWISKEEFDFYRKDLEILDYWCWRDQYNRSNGITRSGPFQEELE